MGDKKKMKKQRKEQGSKQGTNFAVTLITLSIVFVFFGYLIGTYLVGVLQQQHQTTTQLAGQGVSVSAPVATREATPPPASVAPPSVTPEVPTPTPMPAPELAQQSEALYRVQVGVFSERANADRMVTMLKEEGYEGIILPGPPHRVQTGAFGSQENAARLVNELVQKGFEAIIVR